MIAILCEICKVFSRFNIEFGTQINQLKSGRENLIIIWGFKRFNFN